MLEKHLSLRKVDDQYLFPTIDVIKSPQRWMDGFQVQTFWMNGQRWMMSSGDKIWKVDSFHLSGRIRNILQRASNGNGALKIIHWNAGLKHWERKIIELEILISELDPDLFYVSEANLFDSTPMWERELEGYKMFSPKNNGFSWIHKDNSSSKNWSGCSPASRVYGG